ncbi:hypothetical protein SAMN05216274_103210 [Cryobacterium levicorallinum]|uniref:Zinc-ribbon domain-containing protein n=1 Tax=Cryobacterium levicorallinum TaxID=995038 RepID=A0ABY1EB76_9MICO|nr:hypothetical protein SAMN05216274_103210 [Cryobacterium levicorallinum]
MVDVKLCGSRVHPYGDPVQSIAPLCPRELWIDKRVRALRPDDREWQIRLGPRARTRAEPVHDTKCEPCPSRMFVRLLLPSPSLPQFLHRRRRRHHPQGRLGRRTHLPASSHQEFPRRKPGGPHVHTARGARPFACLPCRSVALIDLASYAGLGPSLLRFRPTGWARPVGLVTSVRWWSRPIWPGRSCRRSQP